MQTSLLFFLLFIAVTLLITWWASRRSSGSAAYFAANRQIKGWQNGIAVAGDYMSAASFLGIAGIIAFQGYDGFMYSVGWLVAYLTVLLVVAEPLRNAGKYTMADVLAYRLSPRPVRAMASLSTLTVSTFYMIAQMVGAGALVRLLLKDSGISYSAAVIGVGVLMIAYVVFGGMLATTWVQIIKAILLMSGTLLLSVLVMAHFGFSFGSFFDAVTHVSYTEAGRTVTRDFLQPGLRYKPPYGALDLISLGMALIFGTAGLPHILVRFYTVPDARAARISVVWAMALIGTFYIMTTFLGFGAATIVGRDRIAAGGGTNMSAPLLAQALGGDVFFAFVAAIAFATILAVVAGLTISASASFAHDFWTNVLHHGRERQPGEEVRVARMTAFVIGALAMAIAIVLGPNANVAFLVALAFAVAASANLPVLLFSLFWPRFNTAGAVAGLATGLASSIALILISPSVRGAAALFPLENPGLVSIPLGFLGAFLGALWRREPAAESRFAELVVRANTGLGAEKAAGLESVRHPVGQDSTVSKSASPSVEEA
jgi:cation/acetate symporter